MLRQQEHLDRRRPERREIVRAILSELKKPTKQIAEIWWDEHFSEIVEFDFRLHEWERMATTLSRFWNRNNRGSGAILKLNHGVHHHASIFKSIELSESNSTDMVHVLYEKPWTSYRERSIGNFNIVFDAP
jgi:hypothetical protein